MTNTLKIVRIEINCGTFVIIVYISKEILTIPMETIHDGFSSSPYHWFGTSLKSIYARTVSIVVKYTTTKRRFGM